MYVFRNVAEVPCLCSSLVATPAVLRLSVRFTYERLTLGRSVRMSRATRTTSPVTVPLRTCASRCKRCRLRSRANRGLLLVHCSATVLARAIATEGFNAVGAGLVPKDIQAGINAAVKAVIANLEKQSNPVTTNEEIKQVCLPLTCGSCCGGHAVCSPPAGWVGCDDLGQRRRRHWRSDCSGV